LPLDRRFLRFLPFALAITLGFAPATVSQAETPLSALAGTWSGGGQVQLGDGRSERLSCRAFYTPKEGGASLGMAIRCASPSYKIELRSSLQYSGGRLSGSWEERSFNAGGTISGRASPGSLQLNFTGNVNGAMSLTFSGSSQRVSITSAGGGFSSVSLSLSRG